ncbi:ergothioneine biosynthesis glutamate--cysteine ligase EgtA [Streptomyces sp. NBC_01803]|uniref:ergothioneine biosynthesis glutamate--cysteine ligase EgtA n=1 Tax=Streptomyces sp. NBC_01803 TaxID=2975946 RepID=UPI002DDC070C|nr:ergothioneine biosynthesis glutamate--cysteine ligase EgtA [Streptomyces sp. NBC_01803]WSA43150.1 ergothioneine biosynthesis glutamate--cysteine ligase EgtA [Streptomyces sp. NBC_01803]
MDDCLTLEEAEAYVKGVCFKTGPPTRVGVELEWLVHDRADARLPVAAERMAEALAPFETPGTLPHRGGISREPGGQIELSTAPADSLAGCVEAALGDLTVLRASLAAADLELRGYGLDPHRDPPPRVVRHPRYRAMEAHFDRAGPWGRVMMRGTAAVQISLDAGDDTDGPPGYRYRWRLAHRLGPVLIAAFANSPLWRGRSTGWLSTRQAVWRRIDPTRTRAPDAGTDPRDAWADYALDAQLLCVRRAGSADWSAPRGLTFRSWLTGGAVGRPPAIEDLDYHLTTLFPPVRPRGWLELRMIDAQPGDDGWIVPLAVAAALLDDPVAADAAYAATEPLCGDDGLPPPEVWTRAARLGPADPAIGKAVRACFAAADTALAVSGTLARTRRTVAAFAERYAERGRCPADDQLNELGRSPATHAPWEGLS